MVPDTGLSSNTDPEFVAKPSAPDKSNSSEAENLLNPEVSEALFNTLAEWNAYLEAHLPDLAEERDEPTLGGPSL